MKVIWGQRITADFGENSHRIRTVWLLLQRIGDSFGVLGSDPQQGTRWTFRDLSPLLPVLESGTLTPIMRANSD